MNFEIIRDLKKGFTKDPTSEKMLAVVVVVVEASEWMLLSIEKDNGLE